MGIYIHLPCKGGGGIWDPGKVHENALRFLDERHLRSTKHDLNWNHCSNPIFALFLTTEVYVQENLTWQTMKLAVCYTSLNRLNLRPKKTVSLSLSRFTFQSWKDYCIRESSIPLWSSCGTLTWYKHLERLVLAKTWDSAKSTRILMSHMQHTWTNMAWYLLWKPTLVTARLIGTSTIKSMVVDITTVMLF